MLFPLFTRMGSSAGAATGPPVMIGSGQTQWVQNFETVGPEGWVVTVTVLVKPFTITAP